MVRLRRYNVENLAYFVTTSSFLSRPILLTNQKADIITNHIYTAREGLIEHLLAFYGERSRTIAIMPNHLHLLFVPKPRVTI